MQAPINIGVDVSKEELVIAMDESSKQITTLQNQPQAN